MNWIENNIIELEKRYSEIYHRVIKQEGIQEQEMCSVTTMDAINEERILLVTKNQIDYRLNSLYNPSYEASRWAKQYNLKNQNIVIQLFGMGNGIFIKELMKQMHPTTRILIYEPSIEIFSLVLKEYDISEIIKHPQISLVVEGINENNYSAEVARYIDWRNLGVCITAKHPAYEKIFADSYIRFMEYVELNILNIRTNRATWDLLGKRFVENQIDNLEFLPACIEMKDLLESIPEEVPVFLVAAGPSLDKNIMHLKEAQGKSVIIAVDRSLNVLLQNGIIPDFSVTLDPRKQLFCYETELSKTIPLFYTQSSRYEIVKAHQGKRIFYNTDQKLEPLLYEVFEELVTVPTGGSVANAAFAVAVALGAKKIILVGQDLAFDGEKTHADGARPGVDPNSIVQVEGVYQELVDTTVQLFSYLIWFEEAARSLNEKEYLLIDATEGGALKKGYLIKSLKEVVEEHCTQEFDFGQLLEPYPEWDDVKMNHTVMAVQKAMKELKTIEQYAGTGKKICVEALKELKLKGTINYYQNHAAKLDKYDAYINNASVYGLLHYYSYQDISEEVKDMYVVAEKESEQTRKILTKSCQVYEAMYQASKEIMQFFEKLTNSMQERTEK